MEILNRNKPIIVKLQDVDIASITHALEIFRYYTKNNKDLDKDFCKEQLKNINHLLTYFYLVY